MASPQTGIFALGTASHAYLEFELLAPAELPRRSSLVAVPPRTADDDRRGQPRRRLSTGDVGSGRPGRCSTGVIGFNEPLVGPTGVVLPATQHDVVIWLTGAAYDVVFDLSHGIVRGARGPRRPRARDGRLAVPPRPRPDRLHRRHREPDAGRGHRAWHSIPPVRQARAASILLLQQWEHDAMAWEAPAGGRAGGRSSAAARPTAPSSTHRRRPRTSHARTRTLSGRSSGGTSPMAPLPTTARSSSGFSAEQRILSTMLESMVGRRRWSAAMRSLRSPKPSRVRTTTSRRPTGSLPLVPSVQPEGSARGVRICPVAR